MIQSSHSESHASFPTRSLASLSAWDHRVMEINEGCAVKKTVVCNPPALFIEEVGRWAMNVAGRGRKRKHGLVVKGGEYHPGELDPIPASAVAFLRAAGPVL